MQVFVSFSTIAQYCAVSFLVGGATATAFIIYILRKRGK